jgi:hypothetical protein
MKSTSEFEVEKILEKKNIQNKTYYFVKWKGYDYSQSTWEPIDNLLNCNEKISEYEKSKKILDEEGLLNLNEWNSKISKVKIHDIKLKDLIVKNEIKRIINIREKNNILYALVEFKQNQFLKTKIPDTYIPTFLLKTKNNINKLNDFYESTIHFD